MQLTAVPHAPHRTTLNHDAEVSFHSRVTAARVVAIDRLEYI